jgi:hypothetical protein
MVLTPNQEIKVFAAGVQAFVFAHGRWRVLDPESKFSLWRKAVVNPRLARVLFQTALDLAEERKGGLLVVVSDPAQAVGRLLARHDLLESDRDPVHDHETIDADSSVRPFSLFGVVPDEEASPGENACVSRDSASISSNALPLTKRSIHYLALGSRVTTLDAAVLEALAGLDGALVTDSEARLLAFGAILRHDDTSLAGADHALPIAAAEGARTTAAVSASRFGSVLKISEDGIVSCFLEGVRVWDL